MKARVLKETETIEQKGRHRKTEKGEERKERDREIAIMTVFTKCEFVCAYAGILHICSTISTLYTIYIVLPSGYAF